MYLEALCIAATPIITGLGAVGAYMFATESGDDMDTPEVRRGESSFEPWGFPQAIREYTLPGCTDVMLPKDRVLQYKTEEYDIINDERIDYDELPEG